jgi:beta-glucosidase-like glycosyl hydrolase
MKKPNSRVLILIVTFLAAFPAVCCLYAQEQPAYLNTTLPAQQRAEDLVHRMTIEEKVTQLVNQARAIPRLNVPDYDWWSEALHGVATNGTTEFPEPIGLAATFDTDAIHRTAIVIGAEGRIKHVQAVRAGPLRRLRIWTNRCRCHSSCLRSRFLSENRHQRIVGIISL